MQTLSRIYISISLWGQIFIGIMVLLNPFQTVLAKPQQTLALRAVQSRSFETTDQQKMIQAISSTLQDMGYIIVRSNDQIGFVTATHFTDDIIEITVTTQPNKDHIIVRATARMNNLPLDKNPEFYQNFFNQLSQATFLNANAIY